MPTLSEFNYQPALELWMTEAERRPRPSAPLSGEEYYRGVFPEFLETTGSKIK